jgi:hypothetical protein
VKPVAPNPFLAYAAKAAPWIARKKLRTEQRAMHRVQKKAVIKALSERDQLMRLWKQWRRDLVKAELEGPYQSALQELVDFLNKLTLKDERKVLKIVRAGPWCSAPADVRFLVLRLVDARISTLREKADLPPFDDALWDQPLTTFQLIRNDFMEKTR